MHKRCLSKLERTENLNVLFDTANRTILRGWLDIFKGQSPLDSMRSITGMKSELGPPRSDVLHGLLVHVHQLYYEAEQAGESRSGDDPIVESPGGRS